ncbi:hypothetical protein C8J57DRAFT_1362044 [Mycena rebaudengoi]|nr:hypothetical protein C8J57DRAFT_1362044 [Mycena rebaudengoi]
MVFKSETNWLLLHAVCGSTWSTHCITGWAWTLRKHSVSPFNVLNTVCNWASCKDSVPTAIVGTRFRGKYIKLSGSFFELMLIVP